MQTVLLKANRRIFFLAIVPLLCLLTMIATFFLLNQSVDKLYANFANLLIVIFLILFFFATFFVCWIIAFRPRVVYKQDHLHIAITSGRPIAVPLDVVECFFLGESDTSFQNQKYKDARTQTVVVRLAENAKQWAQRDVLSLIGRWCDGYITLRGTWTEPLSIEVVNRMNHQLAEIKRLKKTEPKKEH